MVDLRRGEGIDLKFLPLSFRNGTDVTHTGQSLNGCTCRIVRLDSAPTDAADHDVLDALSRYLPPQALDGRPSVRERAVPDPEMDAPPSVRPCRLVDRGKPAGDQVGQGLVVEVLVDAVVTRRAGAPAPQGGPQDRQLIRRCSPSQGDVVIDGHGEVPWLNSAEHVR